MELSYHPYSEIFPLMPTEGEEWEKNVATVKKSGLAVPILLHRDGSILDGRNRYAWCKAAGVPARTETFEGTDEEALDRVFILNDGRRHQEPGSRAMSAAKYADLKGRGGDRRSENFKRAKERLNAASVAERFGISEIAVRRAKIINERGDEETKEAVWSGRMRLTPAYEKTIGKPVRAREDRIHNSGEDDLVEALDSGFMSATAACRELTVRQQERPPFPKERKRRIIPIEEFVRELIRKISSVVRSGKMDSVVGQSEHLTTEERYDIALSLRSMATKMLEQADELWPANVTILEEDGNEHVE